MRSRPPRRIRRALLPCVILSLFAVLQAAAAPARGHSAPDAAAAPPPAALAAPGSSLSGAELAWDGSATAGRYGHAMVVDPLRQRLLIFGGHNGSSFRDEVWALSLSWPLAWTRLAVAGPSPGACSLHSAIYDPVGDRVIVFGGWDGTRHNDVWALSLAGTPTWAPLAPAGTPPSPRDWQSAVYDSLHGRMLVFGGWDGSCQSDVWALSLTGPPVWTPVAAAGTPPAGRYGHAAVYDPTGDRMIVFGGQGAASAYQDAWALSLSGTPTWSQLTTSGPAPAARFGHVAIYDPTRARMLIRGGQAGSSYLADAWALSLGGTAAWSALQPAPGPFPDRRTLAAAALDPWLDRLVVFGGRNNPISSLSDAWALALGGYPAWEDLDPDGAPPSPRGGQSAILDRSRDRLVVFGGEDDYGYLGDVRALALDGPPVWTHLLPGGGDVGTLTHHTAIYDPPHDRMLVFGGLKGGSPQAAIYSLSFSPTFAWSALVTQGGPPPPRALHTAIYDPTRERMVVYGGDEGGSCLGDLWALSLTGAPTWAPIAATGTPPGPRAGHVAVYDPVRDRMLVLGGECQGSPLGDVWALWFGGQPAWGLVIAGGTPPSARFFHSAVYDAVRDRVVVFAGENATPLCDDVWALSLANPPTWTQLTPGGVAPGARCMHSAIYDPVRSRMVVFGGGGDYSFLNDLWTFDLGGPVDVPESGPAVIRVELAAPRPNPARGDVTFEFSLPRSAEVSLAVLDLAGRRIRTLAAGLYPAGRHPVVWDRRGRDGRPVPAGIYFAHLDALGAQVTRKAVLTR